MNNKLSFYEKLVFLAYGYFILLGLVWLCLGIYFGGIFHIEASFITIVIFGAQAYFKKKLVNLILGILIFGLSIYLSLEFLYLGSKTGYDFFVGFMLSAFLISTIMAVILIFGYTKLSFKDQ